MMENSVKASSPQLGPSSNIIVFHQHAGLRASLQQAGDPPSAF